GGIVADRGIGQRGRARLHVGYAAAERGGVAADRTIGQRERGAVIVQAAAEVGLTPGDRQAGDHRRPTLDVEHLALAAAVDRHEARPWTYDRRGGRVVHRELAVAQGDRLRRRAEDGRVERDDLRAGEEVGVLDRSAQAVLAVDR